MTEKLKQGAGHGEVRRLLTLTDHRQTPALQASLSTRWQIQRVHRTEEVLWRLRSGNFAALLLCLHRTSETAEQVLEDVTRSYPNLPLIVLVEPGSEQKAAWALARGASGWLPAGPATPILLEAVLDHALLAHHLRTIQAQSLDLEHKEQLKLLAQSLRHEINNPLTGILGNAEIGLKDPQISPTLRRRLSSIAKLAGEISALVRELETLPEGTPRLWQTS